MSFGFSPSDIVALVQLTARVYENWKSACGDYAEVTGQLKSFNVILKRLKKEAEQPAGLLRREKTDYNDLDELIRNSKSTVTQLGNVVLKFKSLGKSRKRNWDRLTLANNKLADMRSKLNVHISMLSAYLETVGISALGRVECDVKDLRSDVKDLPAVVEKAMGKFAAEMRAGKHEGSVMTAYDGDDAAVWRQFRRELIGEGFSSGSLRQYKNDIKQHLRNLREDGLLDEETPSTPIDAQVASLSKCDKLLSSPTNEGAQTLFTDREESHEQSEQSEESDGRPVEEHFNDIFQQCIEDDSRLGLDWFLSSDEDMERGRHVLRVLNRARDDYYQSRFYQVQGKFIILRSVADAEQGFRHLRLEYRPLPKSELWTTSIFMRPQVLVWRDVRVIRRIDFPDRLYFDYFDVPRTRLTERPPIIERCPELPLPPGWMRHLNNWDCIYWRQSSSQLTISEHPRESKQILVDGGGEIRALFGRTDSSSTAPAKWHKVADLDPDSDRFIMPSELFAWQITADAYDEMVGSFASASDSDSE